MNEMDTVEFYEKNGFAVFENAIEHELLDAYNASWDRDNSTKFDEWGNNFGWEGHGTYLKFQEILDILCHEKIHRFFIDAKIPVALHHSDTFGTSSEKPWHHDSTIVNPMASDNYIGVWVAVEDVQPTAGPLEFMPGSHKWHWDKAEIYGRTDANPEPNWKPQDPNYDSIQQMIDIHPESKPFIFLGKKGDLIIWHGNLLHRAQKRVDETITRKAVIGHYCNMHANSMSLGVEFEDGMTELEHETRFERLPNGGYYFKDAN